MPSIHMAVTFAMYLWARDHQHRLAPWLLAYTIVMGFSLVYLAEHYVLDLLVGWRARGSATSPRSASLPEPAARDHARRHGPSPDRF